MRRVLDVVLGIVLSLFALNTAHAASITINDVSDGFTIPFSYSTSGNHYDEVAFNVSGGNFYIELTLVPVSGDFRRLSIALAEYVAPESALPGGHTIEGTVYGYVGNYVVELYSKRLGDVGTITYNLLINTVRQVGGPSLLTTADDCDPPLPSHMPIPAGAVLFGSGLALLGYVGRRRRQSR